MKKNLLLITLLFAIIGLTSCTKRYYAPGLYQNDIQMMLKPHSKDSVKSRFYASGAYLGQSGAGSQGSSTSGLLNIYRSHTLPHFNLSYGVLGYTGLYSRTQTDQAGATTLFVHKTFSGYGFNSSGSFYLSTRKTDFRILGVDLVYTHEGGNFLAFRKSQVGQPNVVSSPRASMFSYGIFTEFIVKPSESTNFGFKFFVNHATGGVVNDLGYVQEPYPHHVGGGAMVGFTSFVGYKHFNFYTTFSTGSTVGDLSGASQLGLAYKF